MKKPYLTIIFVCCALVAAIACSKPAPVTEAETEVVVDTAAADVAVVEADAAGRNDVLYVCNCGPACTCGSKSTKPGTCTCGEELAAAHVVKIEGNEALLCTCGDDCDCALNADDETKCACGKDVRRVSLEGSGLYYCNCGGSCTCNFVSDQPGTCSCGMELTTS